MVAASLLPLSAQGLEWGPNGFGLPTGGAGNWNTTSLSWTPDQVLSYQAWANVSSNAPVAEFGTTGGTVTLTTNITAGGLIFNAGGYALNSSSGSTLTLTTDPNGFSPLIVVANAGDTATINATLVDGNGLTLSGAGTLALTGADTGVTESLAVEGGATLLLYSATGSLNANNYLYLGSVDAASINSGGAGNFVYDNTGATGATAQTIYGVEGYSGDDKVEINNAAGQSITLTIDSLNRTAGATLNFVVNGALNGGQAQIIDEGNTGYINQGAFFGGSSYAYVTGSGVIRGIQYGSDASSFTTGAATSISGSSGYLYVQNTGTVSAQATATFTNLNLSGAGNFMLASSAVLTVNGILKSGNNAATISGGASIKPGSNQELVIRTDQASDALTISTPILANATTRNSNALTKSGAGTLTLSGANTYTGITYIDGGVLSVASFGTSTTAGNLGKSSSAIYIQGGTLDFNGGTLSTTRALDVMVGGGGIDIEPESTLTVSGKSAGANTGYESDALVKTGTGTLILSGSGDNSGFNMVVDAGTVELDKSNSSAHALGGGLALVVNSGGTVLLEGTSGDQIYDNADVQVNGTGVFDMNGSSEAWDGLSGNGIITNNGTSLSTLTLGANGDASGGSRDIFTGTIQDGSGGDKIALVTGEDSGGTQTLSGSSTYSGGTTVEGGTLLVNNTTGSGTGSGVVTVYTNAVLGGHGFISGATEIQAGATLSPSASENGPGLLTFAGGLKLDQGSTLSFALGGASSDEALISGGAFTVTGRLTLNLSAASGFNSGQSYVLLDWNGASSSSVALSDFNLNSYPANSSGTLSLQGDTLVYNGLAATPEPDTFYLLLLPLLALGLARSGKAGRASQVCRKKCSGEN